jgi:UDPglucose 6-dehydrogenase
MKITVVGTGYVGLVAGVCFAESGHTVVCVDIDEAKVEKLKSGMVPIYEPGLAEMMTRNIEKGRLEFTTDLKENINNVEIIFIAVGTPMGEDGSADVQYVLAVAQEIAENMKDYLVVVNKSTVPVGTADLVKEKIKSISNVSFDVVSNPEFMKEGAAITDFMQPDRIVIGSDTDQSRSLMLKLYDPFVRTGAPILCMDIKSAELTKYVSNAMLATKISFMNEMAQLSDAVGADINKVRKAVGADKRIGSSFLFPGVGYGGSCFPKDVKAIEKTGLINDLPMRIMQAVNEVNHEQKMFLTKKIDATFKNLDGIKFAVWGLAFKPKTDDMREAPSLVMIDYLLSKGAIITAFDPEAMQVTKEHYLGDKITYANSKEEALDDAEALLLVTEWSEFRSLDFEVLKTRMKGDKIFDGRNIYDKSEVIANGLSYFGIGC